jgi:HEAT repeat protein
VTPATVLDARGYDPFCAVSVLGTIHALADASHSKEISELAAAGTWRAELLFTLGKVGPPRYANFIGRYRDDPDVSVRTAVAAALGLIDNESVAVPVLIHLLARNSRPDDAGVQWEAANSLIAIAKRKSPDGVRRRLLELYKDPVPMTVVQAARALAATGDVRGFEKLRELTANTDRRVRAEAVLALGEAADTAAREAVTRRLQDDSVAVRATAVYALARIARASAIPTLRKATDDALDYERDLERRRPPNESADAWRGRYGIGEFDLRETLQEALALAQGTKGR